MKTAIIYSEKFLKHDLPSHPENKQRLISIVDLLKKEGFKFLKPEMRREDEILKVHSKEYLNLVKNLSSSSGWLDSDTYVVKSSFEVAKLAVSGVLQAIDFVLEGKFNYGFALVRPPGHHAKPKRGMGFCLFNNVAIGANSILKKGLVERVLILDLDCHHGNGTQEIFYNRNDVLYFSLHQYPYYPGSGSIEEMGSGLGEGFNINIPLPSGTDDFNYLKSLEIFSSIAEQYKPNIILVSMGYDTYWNDPLTNFNLTLNGYKKIAKLVKEVAKKVCKGKLVFVLEGGYNLEGLSKGVANFLFELEGIKKEFKEKEIRNKEVDLKIEEIIRNVKRKLRKYWEIY